MSKTNARSKGTTIALAASLLFALTSLVGWATPVAGAAPSTTSAPAGQTETPSWSFVPLSQSKNFLSRSAIHLLAGPGQTVSDTVVLTNYSDQTLDFNVYGSDAYNTRELGLFTLNPPDVRPKGVGTWITLPVNNNDLPPRTTTEFKFSVKVPANATPGDHAGGIVALNLAPDANPGAGTHVAVQRGEGIAVYVRVPGPLHAGVSAANIGATYSSSPLGIGSGWARVHYQVANTGNVVLNGKSQVIATNVLGSTVHTFRSVPIVALIPGQRMTVVEPKWSGLPFIGPVHLKVIMTTAAATGTGQAQFWIVPWLLVLIIVVVLVVLFVWWRRRRRRRRRLQREPTGGSSLTAAAVAGVDVPATDQPAQVS